MQDLDEWVQDNQPADNLLWKEAAGEQMRCARTFAGVLAQEVDHTARFKSPRRRLI